MQKLPGHKDAKTTAAPGRWQEADLRSYGADDLEHDPLAAPVTPAVTRLILDLESDPG